MHLYEHSKYLHSTALMPCDNYNERCVETCEFTGSVNTKLPHNRAYMTNVKPFPFAEMVQLTAKQTEI